MSTKKRPFLNIFYTFLPVFAYFVKSAKYACRALNILTNSDKITQYFAPEQPAPTQKMRLKNRKIYALNFLMDFLKCYIDINLC